ncbi:MAG: HupE/UreJ family protein [Gammaproteobacteria bacterium]|nr:HupE/UreJ family protein [Gammaproteobacteria bacterium]MDH5653008.1 HupE/UreJ family protein [Gammaproteobacteria bacterium]
MYMKKSFSFLLLLLFFLAGSGLVFGHGMSEAEKQSILDGGNLSYLWLGATHMLTGYDHLLFVFGIIFFLTTFRDIVKYITAFTVGHSITLILATFAGMQINYFLIDAVIGLSVCYIAFANLDGFRKHLQIQPPNLLVMITGLGLIHGLGLSTRLQQLPLNHDQLLLNIISFNIGIELGQVLALAVMLLLLTGWRKAASFQAFSKLSNQALIFAGILLFSMQIHGYWHVTAPDEFGFSSDNHYHDHLRMNETQRPVSTHESID